MGYRSHVAFWFKGPTAQAVVMEHVASRPNAECMDELLITDDGVYFDAPDVKWYDSYNDVIWFNNLYDLAETHEGRGLSGQFVRLGEDDNDVEVRGFGDCWDADERIEVVRELSYKFPEK